MCLLRPPTNKLFSTKKNCFTKKNKVARRHRCVSVSVAGCIKEGLLPTGLPCLVCNLPLFFSSVLYLHTAHCRPVKAYITKNAPFITVLKGTGQGDSYFHEILIQPLKHAVPSGFLIHLYFCSQKYFSF